MSRLAEQDRVLRERIRTLDAALAMLDAAQPRVRNRPNVFAALNARALDAARRVVAVGGSV